MTDQGGFEWDHTLYKYEQIAQVIAERIRTGAYPPQTVLSEVRFEQEFGVSRPTVRLAFKILREENLIVTKPGRGSVVLRRGSAEGS
ncbi:GntR family transcriptional regulator [Nonomuraea solani]|uniref:GntR family transcriptional regulator n=1 Tax=Nonomuraea solani TaxID=1144553 RepID=UPI000CDE61A7|nr:winged helix-turn-helix domain-containing protein [Nonomuraea solani]